MNTPPRPTYFSRKNITIAFLLIFALVAIYIALPSESEEISAAPSDVTRVRRGDLSLTASGEGNLEQVSLPVGFVISGTLTEIAAPGEKIEAGDTLAKLDDRQASLERQAAELDWQEELALYNSASLTAQQIMAQENLADVQNNYKEIVNGPDIDLYQALYSRAVGDYWAAVKSWNSARSSTDKNLLRSVPRLRNNMLKAEANMEYAETALAWAINYQSDPTAVLRVEAQLAEAESELATRNLLVESLTDGTLELDFAESNALPALQNIQMVWSTREQTQLILDHTALEAPFTGTVTQVNAQTGEWVNAYAPLLTLVAEAPLSVEFSLDESDLQNLDVGDGLTLTLTAYANLTLTGEVTQIAPAVNTSTAQVTVWGEIYPDDAIIDILSGMSVDVEVTLAEAQDTLLLPQQAIHLRDDGSAYVNRILDDGGLEEVDVTLGLNDFANVEILSGLAEGDLVSTAEN